jgi:cytochrome c oxidase cbb3-type subunit I
MPEVVSSPLPDVAHDSAAGRMACLEGSCRWPVSLLCWGAAKWLVLATFMGLVASLNFHAPRMFGDVAWLTYGRVQPAFWTFLVYGFGLQIGLGVALWLLVRLGSAPLAFPGAVVAGTVLWNLGLLVGGVGLLAGDTTGHPWLELPGYASPMLFGGYLLIGLGALGTFARRQNATLHPSQWYLLAAVFWFPWIYSTGNLLVVFAPVRGVMQSVVAWWYGAQLMFVWFGFVGLAVLFYLVPRLLNRPLYSHYHAQLAFWLLILFSGWRGIPSGAPVPAWMPGVGTVFAVLTLVPLIALALNFHGTLRGCWEGVRREPTVAHLVAGVGVYLLTMGLEVVRTLPPVGRVTELTWVVPGLQHWYLYGFFAVTLLTAVRLILGRLWPDGFPTAGWGRWGVLLVAVGAAVQAVSLLGGGWAHGRGLLRHDLAFMEAFEPALMAFRLATLGDLLLVVGALWFAVGMGRGLCRALRVRWAPGLAAAFRPEPVTEGRS